MKVKILNSVAGLNFCYAMNEEVDITDEFIANDLIKAGHAVRVEEETVETSDSTIEKKPSTKK